MNEKVSVFIHRSIKTRIETGNYWHKKTLLLLFLYIDPLKQGLKHRMAENVQRLVPPFLYIDPLKQGLKP